nr:hypothetical protein [Tanacetum cinerariifolium]
PVANAPRAVDLADSPVSTSIDQDASSTSHSYLRSKCSQQEYDDFPNGRQTAFLNGLLKEEVYVSQLEGLVDQDNPSHVYKLKKAMYGLNQAPRARDSVDTPMVEKNKLDEDLHGTPVDATLYREPKNFKQAMTEPFWIDAMQDKIHEFERLQFRDWCRVKIKSCHSYLRSKCSQQEYEDFPNGRQTAFLNGLLKEEVYVSQLEGLVDQDNPSHVYKLKKAIDSVDTPMVEKNKLDEDLHGTPVDATLYRVELYFVRTEYQLADIFTKPLSRERFNFLIEKIGMRSMSPKTLKRLTEEENETMNPTASNQIALDNALVPPGARLKIDINPEEHLQLSSTGAFPGKPLNLIKTYYAHAIGAKEPKKAREFKKPTSHKQKMVPVSSDEPTKKHAKYKKDVPSTKKPATKPKPTKKKAPVKADRGKGLNVLLEVALSEAAQLKEQQRKISGTDEGNDTKPEVPDVPKYDYESKKESWGNSGEEDNDDEDDTEDESNIDDNDNDDGNDDDGDHNDNDDDKPGKEEEEYVDEFTNEEDDIDYEKEETKEELDDAEELYRDVNVNLRKEDVKMTDVDQGGVDQHNVSQELRFEQEEEDAHVTLTAVHDTQKTEVIPEIMSTFTTTIPLPHPFFNPLPQQATQTPTPIALQVTTLFPALPDFSFVFRFNDRVTNLERDLLEIKQVDQYAQAISLIPAIVDRYIANNQGEAIQQAIKSHTVECREEALTDMREYIYLIDTSVRAKAIVLAKSSSQPKFTYEAAASLSELELTKILMDNMEEHKSYLRADYKRELYDALVKSYNTDKDLFDTYEEPSHTIGDSRVQQNQEFNTGNNDEQPDDEATSKVDWFKKPKQPLTSDPDWNKRQHVDFRPPQIWISNIARAENPPTSFDELMDTPINFFAFVMNRLNITNLTQELLGPKRQQFYGFVSNRMLSKDVYSRKRIISVTSLKFIKRRVEDLQLGVESYQKKPNLTKPDTFRSNLRNRTAYNAYSGPQRVIFKDQNNKNISIRTDKLHKFSDGTLNYVRTDLHDITSGIRMEYMPKRKWSELDKRRARVMI